jgi:hypothetical protein
MGYTKPLFEVADVINSHRHILQGQGKLNSHQKKVFTNLSQCRTQALGYHEQKCQNPRCDHRHIAYNSCRDRHCPKCNGFKREKWIAYREEDLLPVQYFHTVFTVPEKVNYLFMNHPVPMYNLLFQSVWKTIKQFGSDRRHLGAKTGMIAILHTWGQNLMFHNHIHCIIPAGGITPQGKWRHTKSKGKYLFPVKALSKVFRGIFTDGLIDLDQQGIITMHPRFDKNKKYLHPFYEKKWVVFAKRPMLNPGQVLEYLGRYTHRIAISNHRIKDISDDRVRFSWLDYRHSRKSDMTLHATEFLRRFAMHILPQGFMKIRHYGIMSSRAKKGNLASARVSLQSTAPASVKHLQWWELFEHIFGRNPLLCPKCKKALMETTAIFEPSARGSPQAAIRLNADFDLK